MRGFSDPMWLAVAGAWALAMVLVLAHSRGWPEIDPSFLAFCFLAGMAQLLGNMALVAAFRRANFAESIALHKLEVVFTALVGAALHFQGAILGAGAGRLTNKVSLRLVP